MRSTIGLAIEGFVAFGYILISVLHYFIRDWHLLLKSIAVIHLPTLVFMKWIPESPRFLMCQGKTAEASDVMRKIAVGNGRIKKDEQLSVIEPDALEELNLMNKTDENAESSKNTVLDLFNNGLNMIIVLFIVLLGMFSSATQCEKTVKNLTIFKNKQCRARE